MTNLISTVKMYYEMSSFPYTVNGGNSLSKILLAGDSLKTYKAGDVSIEHHMPH